MKRLHCKTWSGETGGIAGVDRVVLPLVQAGQEPLEACVEVGAEVARGDCVARPRSGAGASLHSSLAGRVAAVRKMVCHDGTAGTALEIEGEASGEPRRLDPIEGDAPPEALRERLREAGVEPLGGNGANRRYATVEEPPAEGRSPETLLVLCVDDEPLLQTQARILEEAADRVVEGAALFARAVGAGRVVFVIFEDQRDGVSGETVCVARRYPEAHPELVMARFTGRYELGEDRPRGDVHLINAETALAAREAVRNGTPVLEKVVTVGTGDEISRVLRVPLGSPFSRLLAEAGLEAQQLDRLFTGGPLRGIAQFDAEAPVTKGTDGLFLQKADGLFRYDDAACVGCGRCVKACPMKIPVNMMTRNCEYGRISEAEAYGLDSCIECGLCAYVCTARRPLLQYILFAKREQRKLEEIEARQTA